MTPDEVRALFTRADGSYAFARWGRPLVPVVFGTDDATLTAMKAAIAGVAALAGHEMDGVDAELGANLMIVVFRDWAELLQVPGLDRMIPDLEPLVARLTGAGANQYRIFRFDRAGAIKATFVFLAMDVHLLAVPAHTVALSQAVQTILLWSDTAFFGRSPLTVTTDGATLLRPDIAALIRAAYDPVLPAFADDPAHALRLAARVGMLQ